MAENWMNEMLAGEDDEGVNIFTGPNSVYEIGTRDLYKAHVLHMAHATE